MSTTVKEPNRVNSSVKPAFLTRCIATVFFSGYTPIAPGTAGSLIALIPLIVFPGMSPLYLALLIAAGFTAGVHASKQFEQAYGDDPQFVVIDETVGMWVTMLFVPITPVTLIAGFLLFRIFDIIKPPPARQLETLPNGWGIMLDDVAAGIYAGLVVLLFIQFI